MLKRILVLFVLNVSFCQSVFAQYGPDGLYPTHEAYVNYMFHIWTGKFEILRYRVEAGLAPSDPVVARYGSDEFIDLSDTHYYVKPVFSLEDQYYHLYWMWSYYVKYKDHPVISHLFSNPYGIIDFFPEEAKRLRLKVVDGNINYFSVVGPFMSSMVPVFLVGIGIGLTIVVLMFLLRMFMRMTVGSSGSFDSDFSLEHPDDFVDADSGRWQRNRRTGERRWKEYEHPEDFYDA